MIKSKLLVKQFKLHVYWNTLQNKYWIKNKQQWMQYRQKFGYIQINSQNDYYTIITKKSTNIILNSCIIIKTNILQHNLQ